MELPDHQTHLQNLVNQANTLSNEIETKRTLLLKVQGVICLLYTSDAADE